MRIDHLHLKNFRCFDKLSLELHPKMTVLVAPNGQGKSTILDAIKVALWPYVAGFDMGSTTNDVTSIQIDDVRRAQADEKVDAFSMEWRLPAEIKAIGRLDVLKLLFDSETQVSTVSIDRENVRETVDVVDNLFPWQVVRYRDSVKKGTRTKDVLPADLMNINAIARSLEQRIFSERDGPPDDLPMLGYYGTGRLWAQKKLTSIHTEADPQSQSRTFAYRDCLDPVSSYKHFAVWFSRVHKAYLHAQIRNLENHLSIDANVANGLSAPFKAVQDAIDALLRAHTGWYGLSYSAEHDELVLRHQDQGILKVSQLSDGIRNVLALVGDIAYRCYKLNAHLGAEAPKRTRGIVMIDEIDMHLHPGWQQTVLSDLSTAFPELQFIVTTHSPQVLTSMKRDNIRMVFRNALNEWEAQAPVEEIKGVESTVALSDIMGVNPIPPVDEAKWLVDYTDKIEDGTHEDKEGRALRAKLIDLYGERHAVLLDVDRLIRFQAFKLRAPRISKD